MIFCRFRIPLGFHKSDVKSCTDSVHDFIILPMISQRLQKSIHNLFVIFTIIWESMCDLSNGGQSYNRALQKLCTKQAWQLWQFGNSPTSLHVSTSMHIQLSCTCISVLRCFSLVVYELEAVSTPTSVRRTIILESPPLHVLLLSYPKERMPIIIFGEICASKDKVLM